MRLAHQADSAEIINFNDTEKKEAGAVYALFVSG